MRSKKMYKKINIDEEIKKLSKYEIGSFMGSKQKYITVIIFESGKPNDPIILEYYFSNPHEKTRFLKKLRELYDAS